MLKEYVDTDIVKLWKYLDGTLDNTFGKFGRFGEVARKIGYKNMMEFYFDRAQFPAFTYSNEVIELVMGFKTFKELKTRKRRVYSLVTNWYERIFDESPDHVQRLYMEYGGGAEYTPSWIFLKEPELIKNQWLVHGTSIKDGIMMARQGFIKGVKDFKKLGLTTFWTGDEAEKSAGGYNFAFTPDDFVNYGMDGSDPMYGDGTLLVFRASGIRCWHEADDQWQTIFNGKTATDIVMIYESMGTYTIYSKDKKKLFQTSVDGKNEPIDAVNWVIDNYDQYRSSIGWEKPR